MAAIVFVGDRELRSITPMSETKYRVVFQNNGQVVELYVKSIYQSDLYGFIEVEEYLFGQKSSVVLDPT